MPTDWIITLGAACAAIISVYKVFEKFTTIITTNYEQTRTIATMNETMHTVSKELKDMSDQRMKSTERLGRTEQDIHNIRRDAEESNSKIYGAIDDLRDDVREDIKELKDLVHGLINQGGEQ